MTPQMLYQVGQIAAERFLKGYRVNGTNQFFENKSCGLVYKDETPVSEAMEICAILHAIQTVVKTLEPRPTTPQPTSEGGE